jgi:hypothetical protein
MVSTGILLVVHIAHIRTMLIWHRTLTLTLTLTLNHNPLFIINPAITGQTSELVHAGRAAEIAAWLATHGSVQCTEGDANRARVAAAVQAAEWVVLDDMVERGGAGGVDRAVSADGWAGGSHGRGCRTSGCHTLAIRWGGRVGGGGGKQGVRLIDWGCCTTGLF